MSSITKTDIDNEVSKIELCEEYYYPRNGRIEYYPEFVSEFNDFVLENVKNSGLWLEFGTFKGCTANYFSSKTENILHGFDTFKGVDVVEGSWDMRRWNRNGALPKVNENVNLVVGLFQDTLDNFLKEYTDPVSFLHIDCDIYSSTKFVLDTLYENNRIVKGTIILFDEIWRYSDYDKHEILAWLQFVQKNNIKYEWIARSGPHNPPESVGQQAACVIL